ncbi:PREDICTED: UPF0193 protein EVG1 homolog [Nicrophorus vespilloides]|uniref:UPF0193 protein EVG1 homolog n=1 Tax=Nicrophorus vespilloides TaxID=110193 RepID=A0ABM1N1I0_NICVS|nr:PREDICTED: UPF0193 protein EVG1 homolog [Nicrophorus vespilloides]XP_017780680.1 PREDICTED: UPF0193 protein EVG1 homolog [Nicrophorus vespilloides]XP_017780754.1 PREDICTED: UPF0193 protein EVG1 homolog [Nicrophorus vespilloides]
MEWPSKNVAKGGVFQHAKVNYSPETTRFLQTLINESKMTTMQRNRINYSLRSGEPLPSLAVGERKGGSRNREPKVYIRPGSSKRRSLDSILKSGAYSREQFTPTVPRVDREKAKEELQQRMAFGRKGKPPIVEARKQKREEPKEMNRFDEIKQEIKEREEWLKEMEALGEGDKYRLVINQQIQDRIREMRRMKISDE